MSVVAAAIIAGATAGLTKIGNEAVFDLYKILKAKITSISKFDFSAIEKAPKDSNERLLLENRVNDAKLNEVAIVKEAAALVIAEALRKNMPMDKAWLVEVGDLVAKKSIEFRDIDTKALLLKANSAKTDGSFIVQGIRHTGSSNSESGPLIQAGYIQAQSVSAIQNIINNVPKWLKTLIVIAAFALISKLTYDYLTKRANFDAAVDRIFSQQADGYMGSVNAMLQLQGAIENTRDNGFWTQFTSDWRRHIGRLEQIFEPLSTGLTADQMSATGSSQRICPNIEAVLKSHYAIIVKIINVLGISVSFSAGTGMSELSVFGPLVSVPSTREIESVFVQACAGDLKSIKNPPDNRTPEEKRRDTLAAIDLQIGELKELKRTDFIAAQKQARKEFIATLSRYYISQRMYPVDAISQAEQEYEDVYTKSGINYQVPQMNDLVDRIRYINRVKNRDFDSEIRSLEQKKSNV